MEYDDSISLYDFMRNDNGFTESELREIAGCCLLGLDHLHKHNLSHSVCIWNEAQLVGHDIESCASFKEGSDTIECIL